MRMGDRTGIQWTDATWNPVTGCTKVSPGCQNCYAYTLAHGRLKGHYLGRAPAAYLPTLAADPFAVRLWPERLDAPRSWKLSRMVFVLMPQLQQDARAPDKIELDPQQSTVSIDIHVLKTFARYLFWT
jgi:protein gp37